MGLSRTLLRATAKLLVGVMLFAQMAIAAYACLGPAAMPASAQEEVIAMAAIPADCDMAQGANSGKSALCLEHCRSGQQASQPAPAALDFAGVPVLLYAHPVTTEAVVPSGQYPAEAITHAGAPPKPPHAVLHCVWRI